MIVENEANALPHDAALLNLPVGDPLPEANDTSANESPKTPVVLPDSYESDDGSEVTNDTEEKISTGSGSDEEEEKGTSKHPSPPRKEESSPRSDFAELTRDSAPALGSEEQTLFASTDPREEAIAHPISPDPPEANDLSRESFHENDSTNETTVSAAGDSASI